MDMKYLVRSWALLCAVVLCLTACGSSDDDGAPVADVETVQLIISVPATSAGTRMGDPGTAVDEGADWDWDRLAVILAYTDDSQVTLPGGSRVLVKTLSKSEFGKLPKYNNGNSNYRMFSVDAQPGKVYVYGVTYSADAANGPAEAIAGCTTNADVQALALSNDYTNRKGSDDGSVDYAKFVSVATGYYKGEGSTPATLEIKEGGTGEIGSIPTMTLTRLAAKIDIQWDAADAYEAGYTDVKVTDFQYNGSAQGRLFPDITIPEYSATGQQRTFYNTSEISQRNGRVYHYTFPDGKTTPSVTFNIYAKKTGETESTTKSYTMNFPSALQKATWYKVNATIKGITGDGTITLSMDNNTGVQTGG